MGSFKTGVLSAARTLALFVSALTVLMPSKARFVGLWLCVVPAGYSAGRASWSCQTLQVQFGMPVSSVQPGRSGQAKLCKANDMYRHAGLQPAQLQNVSAQAFTGAACDYQ
jgi:hypothetical protein